jgi:hypothetical protein
MPYFLGGMNIEIKKLLSILIEKTEEDISISSENQVEVNQYISDILPDKTCGTVMESAS